MNLYAESSALLCWLLSEPEAVRVDALLTKAKYVVSSDLTLIECDRALLRAISLHKLSPGDGAELRRKLASITDGWTLLRISPEIVERARRSFPIDTIRALDAIHLASALRARASIPDLQLLSLDGRVREVAKEMGLNVQPAV